MDPSSAPQDSNFPTSGEKVFQDPAENKAGDALSDPNSPLKQIRTFQGDIAEAIRLQNESLVSIQRAEQARQASERAARGEVAEDAGEVSEHRGRKGFIFFVLSLILIGLGALGGWFGYQEIERKMTPPAAPVSASRLIASTDTKEMDATRLSRLELIERIATESESAATSGQTLHLDLKFGDFSDKQTIATQKFFEILEVRAQGSLMRALDSIFMLGALGGERKSIFIIIPVLSFENAFPGMLTWEETLAEDLGPIFATRNLLSNLTEEPKFEDMTTRNKDARVLRDSEGNIVLLYSFFDTQTLIITDSEESLRALIARLTNELLSR